MKRAVIATFTIGATLWVEGFIINLRGPHTEMFPHSTLLGFIMSAILAPILATIVYAMNRRKGQKMSLVAKIGLGAAAICLVSLGIGLRSIDSVGFEPENYIFFYTGFLGFLFAVPLTVFGLIKKG